MLKKTSRTPEEYATVQYGFTLIELMVVVAIMAILTTIAAPSFVRVIQSSTMSSNVNTFLGDVRFARSEAIRRGGGVVMCRSDDPEAASPVCGAGSGPGGNGWVSGWIIFHDLNNSGTKTALEPLLRVQSAITSMDSIVESGGSSSTKFRFTATGRMLNLNSATSIQFGGGNYDADVQRMVCVNLGGRARIAGNGNSACGSDQ
jgi:type IV fimbrial biogenesis protein FimT